MTTTKGDDYYREYHLITFPVVTCSLLIILLPATKLYINFDKLLSFFSVYTLSPMYIKFQMLYCTIFCISTYCFGAHPQEQLAVSMSQNTSMPYSMQIIPLEHYSNKSLIHEGSHLIYELLIFHCLLSNHTYLSPTRVPPQPW